MFSDLHARKVRLSVWRDEFKGVTNNKVTEDPDVIDLTEPTLVGTEDDGRTPSLPPASSEAGDDEFDIDAVIRAEEERLATLRATTADSGSPHTSRSPTLPENALPKSGPEANAMDVDEESLWDTLDDPSQSGPPSAPAGDEDMWNIIDEIEQGGQSKPAQTHIPLSGVNLLPSLDSTDSGNASRATNDDDWDEMYS